MAATLSTRLQEAFAAHADRPAVYAGNDLLTYADLARRAEVVRAHLAAAGIGRGDRVAFWMEKSFDALAVLLGALFAGAAYVPIDPRAPWLRAAAILGDCGPAALAVDALRAREIAAHRDEIDGGLLILQEGVDPLGPGAAAAIAAGAKAGDLAPLSPEDPAYILYTSGSTGRPKGVVLSHRAALGFVDWSIATFSLGPDDRATSHAPFHFDLSTFDLFATLCSGGSVRLLGSVESMVYPYLVRMLPTWGITVWYSVPSALIGMLQHGALSGESWPQARVVLFAGEVFPTPWLARLRRALPRPRLFNLFGPTETNVCTYYEVGDVSPDETRPIPIGRICEHLDGAICDDAGREVAPGEEGNLLVGGDNLLTEYWGDPVLTARRLRADPRPGRAGVLFNTGDRVRAGADGNLIFLGRRDHQVKVRGYRVELGEIESVLHGLAGIADAAVVAVPDDGHGHRLLAYVVIAGGAGLEVGTIRSHLTERVPLYMVPEQITVVPQLPRTSTGKIDRVALAATAG
ncbi:MAG TPA: amino acid adenylation domain-containing protein [Candidatus Krumholzibacteria bacterium]|nr:amino acid adenylation domain-containing protein [Candidatus Krumholzibacteria bacterium]HPD70823.1 amino acid adenylation domain-containing protein [Candidatus Krumholzibacteria bacterium]HRY39477.1 amino acid adenylation domain-containing protein [Candidatus Krumholzibacteria bacterium]